MSGIVEVVLALAWHSRVELRHAPEINGRWKDGAGEERGPRQKKKKERGQRFYGAERKYADDGSATSGKDEWETTARRIKKCCLRATVL